METSNPYFKQVKLLVEILPLIANHECFALKGGTAINLFVRDLPRLSVDVDLTYVPVVKREKALVEIDASLRTLKTNLTKSMGLKVTSRVLSGTKYLIKLLVQTESVHVRIETTPVMRGVVNGLVDMEISPKVQDVFGYVRVPVVSFNDLYSEIGVKSLVS